MKDGTVVVRRPLVRSGRPRYTRDVPPTFIDRGLMRERNLVRRAFAAGVWLLLIVGALTFLLRWRANNNSQVKGRGSLSG
jgi:hypothetical protein